MILSSFQLSGIIYGAVIGLLTIGFRLTHQTSGYMNLGHTVNIGVGMMLGFIVIQQLRIAPIMGTPFAFILTGAFNAGTYFVFFSRMKIRGYSEALIGLFGLTLMFLGGAVLTVSTYLVCNNFPSEYWCGVAQGLILNHIHYRAPRYEAIGVFLVIITAAVYFYNRTSLGLKFKALAENPSLLEICGINSERARSLSWFISGGLAGVAGIILPYVYSGHFALVEGYFGLVVVAAVLSEKKSPWVWGLSGLLVGYSQHVLITWGASVLGIWFAEYRNILTAFTLAIVVYLKDRRISWLS